jgi:hypothetical protein
MYADDYGTTPASGIGADFEQDPNETVDYGFDWSGRLDGDTIATSTMELPDGLTEVSSSYSTTAASIFVSAAGSGIYRITNRVTTAAGRTWEKTIRIAVRDS